MNRDPLPMNPDGTVPVEAVPTMGLTPEDVARAQEEAAMRAAVHEINDAQAVGLSRFVTAEDDALFGAFMQRGLQADLNRLAVDALVEILPDDVIAAWQAVFVARLHDTFDQMQAAIDAAEQAANTPKLHVPGPLEVPRY